jgi:RHS repeat-associated protein
VTTTRSVALGLGGGEQNVPRREAYDGQGRLFRVEEYSNPAAPTTYVKTDYAYDEGSRLVRVCQSASGASCGQERLFSYDNRGFLVSEQHPEKGATGNGLVTYPAYDSRGHVLQRHDGSTSGGDSLRFVYDGAERVTTATTLGGTMIKKWVWDIAPGAGAGKVHETRKLNFIGSPESNHLVMEHYEYNGRMGRPSKRSTTLKINAATAETWNFTAAYDELGLPSSIDYPTCSGAACAAGTANAPTISFTRQDGLLTAIPGWTAAGQSIAYHPNLLVASVPHANGMIETIDNDPYYLSRPDSISASALDASGQPYTWTTGTYAFDGAGNIRSMTNGAVVERLRYDKVSRLVEAELGSEDDRRQSYVFDTYGNITSKTTDAPMTGVPVTTQIPVNAATNRLSGAVSYDNRGNLTAWNGHTYDFRHFNEMRRRCASSSGSSCLEAKWAYAYTADEERVLAFKEDGSEKTWTIRDFGNRVLRRVEVSGGSTDLKDYVYRDDKLLGYASSANGNVHAAVDHLGTIRMRTLSDGTLPSGSGAHSLVTYFPFGEQATLARVASSVFDGDVLQFTGHERDRSVGGLDYMHARYYSNMTFRFLSTDPVGGHATSPQSWNRYAYVMGNPLTLTDPTGEFAARAAELAQDSLENAKNAAVAAVSDGSVLGVVAATAVGTVLDLASGLLEPLKAGDAIGTAMGSGAEAGDTALAIGQDVLRTAGLVAPLAGVGRSVASGATVKLVHFTDDAGRAAIQAAGNLRAGTYVTRASEVRGLSARQIESKLEILPGRGEHSFTVRTTRGNIAIPENGARTSSGAYQRQLKTACATSPSSCAP